MTVAVYGAVALIVRPILSAPCWRALATARCGPWAAASCWVLPLFLKTLSTVGMVAMLWVGGHIVIHGATSWD